MMFDIGTKVETKGHLAQGAERNAVHVFMPIDFIMGRFLEINLFRC